MGEGGYNLSGLRLAALRCHQSVTPVTEIVEWFNTHPIYFHPLNPDQPLHTILSRHGLLIEPEAMDYVLEKEDPPGFLSAVIASLKEVPLTLSLDAVREAEGGGLKLPENGFSVVYHGPGEMHGEPRVGDFTALFNNRLAKLKRLLRQRAEVSATLTIAEAKRRGHGADCAVIGLVSDVQNTRKGGRLVKLEDETGVLAVFLNPNGPLADDVFLKDEAVCLLGSFGREREDATPAQRMDPLFFPDSVVRPEAASTRRLPVSSGGGDPGLLAVTSDIHLGSRKFYRKRWEAFISWLRGEADGKQAARVKYLLICGDAVDGVGIYPQQVGDLELLSVEEQYSDLAKYIERIPERVKVIIIPGNHDAVRLAEPQPALPEYITSRFPRNVLFLGNPCLLSLGGPLLLAYHGCGMDDLIQSLPGLTYGDAVKMMIEMLRRRHLSPVFGGKTPLAPGAEDRLVIEQVPDIFVTGHGHGMGVERYRSTILINSSTWQAQTSYQKMMNFIPVPCKVPLVDLRTWETPVLDFM